MSRKPAAHVVQKRIPLWVTAATLPPQQIQGQGPERRRAETQILARCEAGTSLQCRNGPKYRVKHMLNLRLKTGQTPFKSPEQA